MNLKAMFFKKILFATIASLSLAVVALALINPHSGLSLNSFKKSGPINSISGREGGDAKVLVVKIDDTPMAHPQIGLEDADIIYIEQVEGGLTRLAAVFSSTIPTRVGPVRSARISDIELFAQYGHVAFAYSGAQKKMAPVIAGANLENLGAQNHSSTIYTTDPARVSPYAMVLRADLLMDLVASKNLDIATSKSMGWRFGDAPAGGVAITDVHISWPAHSYDAHWSPAEKRWLLDHGKTPNLSDSGIHLGPATLVIQNVSITDSIYKDKVGGITPYSVTVGTGTGYVLRNGKSFAATWSRPTQADGTTWQTLDGKEIPFEKGQIWVALTDKAPLFTRKIADAAP
jgi:hypothetical protein